MNLLKYCQNKKKLFLTKTKTVMLIPFSYELTKEEKYKNTYNSSLKKAKHLLDRVTLFVKDIDRGKLKEKDKEEIKNILINKDIKTSHDEIRTLTHFQHWLGSNYNDLPTDSGNMTKRAVLFLKYLKKEETIEINNKCKCQDSVNFNRFLCPLCDPKM